MEHSGNLKSRFERFFTIKRVIILAVLWIIANSAFHFGPWSTTALAEVSGGREIPDLKLNYDLEWLRNLFAAYGPEGIRIYKNIQLIDFVYPLIYGALLLGLMIRVKLPQAFKFNYYIPFYAVLLDYTENLLLRHFISIYPNLDQSGSALIDFCSIITMLKWVNIMLALSIIVGFWLWNIFSKKKKQLN